MKKYLAAAALLCMPGVAFAQEEEAAASDFTGVRIEARLGYETPTVSDGTGAIYKIGSAVSYGGEIGFDVQTGGSVVVGAYGNYEFSSVDLCDGGDCLGEKGNLSVGARVGLIAGPTTLVYVKGGYASIEMKAKSGTFTGSETKGGVQGALGVEFGLQKNVYAFFEGSYADYGDFYGINLQRRHVAGGIGLRF